jgi:catechol 2,3-dioxygenase-like lactoylglutathione lyase family enzyme
MATVSVRYIVDDVEAAIAFYTERLGFGVEFNPAGFAVLSRDDLRLLLNEPGAGGAGQPMPANPCPTGASPSRAAGTASSSRSMISPARSRPCERREHNSATRSSAAEAASRSS